MLASYLENSFNGILNIFHRSGPRASDQDPETGSTSLIRRTGVSLHWQCPSTCSSFSGRLPKNGFPCRGEEVVVLFQIPEFLLFPGNKYIVSRQGSRKGPTTKGKIYIFFFIYIYIFQPKNCGIFFVKIRFRLFQDEKKKVLKTAKPRRGGGYRPQWSDH